MLSKNDRAESRSAHSIGRARWWLSRRALASGVALAVTAGAAYMVARPGGGPALSTVAVVTGQASERFPARTLDDWVTFADQVSVVSVLDETEIPPGSDSAADGDYVLRNVTLRIQDTPWRRPGAPSAPETLSVKTWGWFDRDGQRSLHVAPDAPRLEVGQRYLTPLVRPSDGWTPLADASILKLSGDTATSEVATGKPRRIAESLRGRSVEDIATALAATRPRPEAARFMQLDPDARVRSVLTARFGSPGG